MISASSFTTDKARTVLFLLSTSVILITLGIIQTLLFETITFFQDVAASRGWLSMKFDFSGISSSSGIAGIILIGCFVSEYYSKKSGKILNSIPEEILFPNLWVIRFLGLFSFLTLILLQSQLLAVSIIILFFTWRGIASTQFKNKNGGKVSKSNNLRIITLLFIFVTFFDALTYDYGGAFGEFLLTNQWTPSGGCPERRELCDQLSFGVNSLLLTTIQVAFGALLIAVPLGVGCAIYLSEYAHPRLVAIVKPTLEILAGIPSVVYGFFAFIYIGPLVVELGEYAYANGWINDPPDVFNPINGAIVVGVMILPLVASMSEDALRAVPNELREGSLALGATRIETTVKVMIQASLSGIIASIILALSRAVGETMAVTLAVGTIAVYTSNMFLPAQTMTAYIAQRVGGDLPFGEIGYYTIFAVGLYLFVITLSLNLLGNKILSTYREAY